MSYIRETRQAAGIPLRELADRLARRNGVPDNGVLFHPMLKAFECHTAVPDAGALAFFEAEIPGFTTAAFRAWQEAVRVRDQQRAAERAAIEAVLHEEQTQAYLDAEAERVRLMEADLAHLETTSPQETDMTDQTKPPKPPKDDEVAPQSLPSEPAESGNHIPKKR